MKTIQIKECTKLKAIRNEVVNKLNADITKKKELQEKKRKEEKDAN